MITTILAGGERRVTIPAGTVVLPGTLAWPNHPSGLVLFAHGSGSGRLSPRNAAIARQLRADGLGTLLFDLLSETEAGDRRKVFDVALLADRLLVATEWAERQAEAAGLTLGYFGASTGAAAALSAAARSSVPVGAVVSRGGRPDLAMADLSRVRAPTLLLVGSRDPEVLQLNRLAYRQLVCDKRLIVVPGAGHLFEEPGTLEQVGQWAAEWFIRHLAMERTWRTVPE